MNQVRRERNIKAMDENYLNQINSDLKKSCPEKDQYYFGHGKLLLTGEYFVLDGASALALPTKLGQSLSVKYFQTYRPTLSWKAYDVDGNLWIDGEFEFWHFKILNENPCEKLIFLQKILQQVRKQNPHFLRDDVGVKVETKLGFPSTWGLGSSSSLIYNIAQWAYVSPFELLFKTHGGSGYDIACAQSDGPIIYRKMSSGPHWTLTYFNPSFISDLYFIYLGKKQDSREAIKDYIKRRPVSQITINQVTELTHELLSAQTLKQFQSLIKRHEEIVSLSIGQTPVKDKLFFDFPGAVKSLGAWGGDFVLAATDLDYSNVKKYFAEKGLTTVYRYNDLIAGPIEQISSESMRHYPTQHLVH